MSEKTITLTENDIKIMSLISDKEAGTGLSKAKGTTVEDIKNKAEVSISKIRDALGKLEQLGYIAKGIKRGNKNTYHITTNGINYILEIKKTVINIQK